MTAAEESRWPLTTFTDNLGEAVGRIDAAMPRVVGMPSDRLGKVGGDTVSALTVLNDLRAPDFDYGIEYEYEEGKEPVLRRDLSGRVTVVKNPDGTPKHRQVIKRDEYGNPKIKKDWSGYTSDAKWAEAVRTYREIREAIGEVDGDADKRAQLAVLRKNAPWQAQCMGWMPKMSKSFNTGKGLGPTDIVDAFNFIEDLKQKAINAMLDLAASAMPEGVRQGAISARIGLWVKNVTQAALCFSSSVRKANALARSHTRYVQDALDFAVAQKAYIDSMAASYVRAVEWMVDYVGSGRWKGQAVDVALRLLTVRLKGSQWGPVLGDVRSAIDAMESIVLESYSAFDWSVSDTYRMLATLKAIEREAINWRAASAFQDAMESMRSQSNTVTDNYLDGFDAFAEWLNEFGSYSFSLTNSGAWQQYSMNDDLKVIPRLQAYIDNYSETYDSSGPAAPPPDRGDFADDAEYQKALDEFNQYQALLVSRSGVFIDSRSVPGRLLVDDTAFGLISCGLGATVDPRVSLIFDLIIDDGATIVTAIAKGGQDSLSVGKYISYSAQDLRYSMIFPVVGGGVWERLPDSAMVGDVSVGGNTLHGMWGYGDASDPSNPKGGYPFDAWELIVDDLGSVSPGDVFVYMNPNTLQYHGQRVHYVKTAAAKGLTESKNIVTGEVTRSWHIPKSPGDRPSVKVAPYEYRVVRVDGGSVIVERVKDVTRWLPEGEYPLLVDSNDDPIMTADFDGNPAYALAADFDGNPDPAAYEMLRPLAYHKPLVTFGMGVEKDGWGLGDADFVECRDACPPMTVEPLDGSGRTLYSSASKYSPGSGPTWNMAVREESVKLTRMFGAVEPSEAPHALDSIRCKNWALYARFAVSGHPDTLKAVKLIRPDHRTRISHFFLKAKWGFIPDEPDAAGSEAPDARPEPTTPGRPPHATAVAEP